jgi:ferredoxin-fold anticodon binding domain-containing protein
MKGIMDLLTRVSKDVRVAIVYAGRVHSGARFAVVMCEFG